MQTEAAYRVVVPRRLQLRSPQQDLATEGRQEGGVAEVVEVPVVTPHGLRGTHGTLARASGAMGHLVA